MSHHPTGMALVAILTVLCGTGCDSPVSPAEAQAPRSTQQQERLLLQVLTKLDSLEARLDRATASAMTVAAARADNAGGVGVPAQMTELRELSDSIMARTVSLGILGDSIMALASFVAADVADPLGLEVCGQIGWAGQAELKWITQGSGEAEGGVGVKPLDTGAQAKASLKQGFRIDASGGPELGAGFEACLDLGALAASPPTRPATTFATAGAVAADPLQGALLDVQTRLGLDAGNLRQAIIDGTDIFESGDLTRLADLPRILPGPPALGSPLSLIRRQLSTFDSVDLLCGGTTFETRIQNVVNEGCDFIRRDDLPDLGTFKGMGDDLASLQDDFDALCARVNDVIRRRLVVSTDAPWTGGDLNVRLFPDSWLVACGA